MLRPSRFELLGAVDTRQVAHSESVAWRPAVDANWYVRRHGLKFSVMHRETFNGRGQRGVRIHATFLQAQLAF